MHSLFHKTLFGLSARYYIRQLLFGIVVAGLMAFAGLHGENPVPASTIIPLSVINTFLYPYARFAYESFIGFIFGENVFIVNVWFLFCTKLVTMSICWFFAILIAPIGFLCLYYQHTKAERA